LKHLSYNPSLSVYKAVSHHHIVNSRHFLYHLWTKYAVESVYIFDHGVSRGTDIWVDHK